MHLDLSPIFPYVNEFLVTVLIGAVTLATVWLKQFLRKRMKFLDEQTDQTLAEGFNRALQNGVNIAMHLVQDQEAKHAAVDLPVGGIKGWVAERAAQYAINHSPDYVARFLGDKDPDTAMRHAAEKALAYIPVPPGDPAPAPIPVEVEPLPPAAGG